MSVALDGAIRRLAPLFRAPRLEPGSRWADRNYWLSTGARVGRWQCLAFQREILDSLTDPGIDRVTLLKSTQVGATQMGNILVAQRIAQRPSSILVVQPTIPDAEEYSQAEISVMLDALPCLRGLVKEPRTKGSDTAKKFKRFPGGILRLRGGNAPSGLRRFGADTLFGDEAEAWPASAGGEGDPLALAEQRTKDYAERLIYLASTPVHFGGRIQRAYLSSDRGRYQVPCLRCGVFDFLIPWLPEGHERTPDGSPPTGHQMTWPKGKPHLAHFVCSGCSCEIPAIDLSAMVAEGFWKPGRPGARSDDGRLHRGFHVWAALSPAPNASLGQIATRVEAAGDDAEALRVVVNTDMGLPFTEVGEAPEWQHLFDRREHYPAGTVPAGVRVLTAGVDVQGNRLVYEVVGWGRGKESWSIEAGELPGSTVEGAEVWGELSAKVMNKEFPGTGDARWSIRRLAIDSGASTDAVYAWVKRNPRAIAVKGVGIDKPSSVFILGAASKHERRRDGQPVKRQRVPVRTVGVGRVKGELYGQLGMALREDGTYPPGYCHFPQHGDEYFRQLTAEEKRTTKDERGFPVEEWVVKPGRQNHGLDARVYARAALEHPASRSELEKAEREASEAPAKPAVDAGTRAAAEPDPPPLTAYRPDDRDDGWT